MYIIFRNVNLFVQHWAEKWDQGDLQTHAGRAWELAQSGASVPVVTAFAQHSLLLATTPKPMSVFTIQALNTNIDAIKINVLKNNHRLHWKRSTWGFKALPLRGASSSWRIEVHHQNSPTLAPWRAPGRPKRDKK